MTKNRNAVTSFNLSIKLLDVLDDLVAKRKFRTKTEIVEEALVQFLISHKYIKIEDITPQKYGKMVPMVSVTL